jgi:hypothetical protein
MNLFQKRITTYAIAVVVVLFILVLVVRYALREAPAFVDQQPTNLEPTKSETRQTTPDFAATDDQPIETPPVSQPEKSTVTNAAAIYRQAFALYDALSKDEKGLLADWRTNADSSVEAKLCEELRPICDLMHQATAVTNCDWGIEPLTYDTKLPHLSPARAIARAAVWNAAHCRANDMKAATDDVLSALRLGQSVSHSALIGCLVDMAIQSVAWSYVGTNLGSLPSVEGQRILAAFSNPAYEEEASRAMEQTAGATDRLIVKLASLPADEFEKEISQVLDGQNVSNVDRAAALASLQQIANSERDLARALASGSADEYEAWAQDSAELQNSNPLAKMLGAGAYDGFVNRVQRETVKRDMVVAALAVAQDGASALQSHPDPATGQPFGYTETSDGFELQSGFKTNGVPLKMQFK